MAHGPWSQHVLLLLAITVLVSAEDKEAVVSLPFGRVIGNLLPSSKEFLGIPFAAPPERFAQAQAWTAPFPNGSLNAMHLGSQCPQPTLPPWPLPKANFSEDCLVMNIYVPKGDAPNSGWPVMVYIHGGGLAQGSANDPDVNGSSLAAGQQVVVFEANYRLGVFGFMVVAGGPGGAYLANNGFRDQQMALRWVRQHAQAFGGNPRQVTIFGESAGGQSTCVHVVSPLSAGLFDAAIGQSPDIGDYIGTVQEAVSLANTAARQVGCVDAKDLPCLREVPWQRFFDGASFFTVFALSKPVVDNDAAEPVLPAAPNEMVRTGRFNRVPLVIGNTWREGDGLVYPPVTGSLPATGEDVRCALAAAFGAEKAEKLAPVFPVDDWPGIDNRNVLSEIAGDLILSCGARSFALALAAQDAEPWYYLFDRHSTSNCTYMDQENFVPVPGAAHGVDVPYSFDNVGWLATNPVTSQRPTNTTCKMPEEDLALAHWTAKLWADFAHTGKMADRWSKFSAPDESALHIDIASPKGHMDMVMGRFRVQCDALGDQGLGADVAISLLDTIQQCQKDRQASKLHEKQEQISISSRAAAVVASQEEKESIIEDLGQLDEPGVALGEQSELPTHVFFSAMTLPIVFAFSAACGVGLLLGFAFGTACTRRAATQAQTISPARAESPEWLDGDRRAVSLLDATLA